MPLEGNAEMIVIALLLVLSMLQRTKHISLTTSLIRFGGKLWTRNYAWLHNGRMLQSACATCTKFESWTSPCQESWGFLKEQSAQADAKRQKAGPGAVLVQQDSIQTLCMRKGQYRSGAIHQACSTKCGPSDCML